MHQRSRIVGIALQHRRKYDTQFKNSKIIDIERADNSNGYRGRRYILDRLDVPAQQTDMKSTSIKHYARPDGHLRAASIEKSVMCGAVADVTSLREHAKLAVQRRNGGKRGA